MGAAIRPDCLALEPHYFFSSGQCLLPRALKKPHYCGLGGMEQMRNKHLSDLKLSSPIDLLLTTEMYEISHMN